MRKLYIFGLIGLAVLIIGIAWAEQITFSTYYPAPYGVYREMRATRMAVGDDYIDGGTYSWGDGSIHSDADLIVQGRVGIGTAAPNTDFTIHRAGGAIMDLEVDDTDIGGGEVLGEVQFRALESTYLHRMGANITAVADSSWNNTSANRAAGRLEFYTQSDNDGDGLANPRMVIDSDGNVGIGTAGPTSMLQIGQDAQVQQWTNNVNPQVLISGVDNETESMAFKIQDENQNEYLRVSSTASSASDKGKVYIAGNVGIGTDQPKAALDVDSTTSGFLPPRMNQTELDNIEATATEGSVAYNTTDDELNYRDATGWRALGGGGVDYYDSGWFAVNTTGAVYTKAHELGTIPSMVQLWISNTNDPATQTWVAVGSDTTNPAYSGGYVVDVDDTNITIRCQLCVACIKDASGTGRAPTSGYARITAVAF